jgi:hypothetical protein
MFTHLYAVYPAHISHMSLIPPFLLIFFLSIYFLNTLSYPYAYINILGTVLYNTAKSSSMSLIATLSCFANIYTSELYLNSLQVCLLCVHKIYVCIYLIIFTYAQASLHLLPIRRYTSMYHCQNYCIFKVYFFYFLPDICVFTCMCLASSQEYSMLRRSYKSLLYSSRARLLSSVGEITKRDGSVGPINKVIHNFLMFTD